MALSTKSVFNTEKDYYREDNLFVREGVITAVGIKYGKPNRFGTVRDVILTLHIKNGDFKNEVEIEGNYKRDEQGNIVGWGALFRIAILFETSGISTEVDDAGNIPVEALKQLQGKKVFMLSAPYQAKPEGGYKYYTYTTLLGQYKHDGGEYTLEEAGQELVSRFKNDRYAYPRYLKVVGEGEAPEASTGSEFIFEDTTDFSEDVPF